MQVLRVSFLATLFSHLDVSNTESSALQRVPQCVLLVVTSSVVFFVVAYFVHSWLSGEEVKWRMVSLDTLSATHKCQQRRHHHHFIFGTNVLLMSRSLPFHFLFPQTCHELGQIIGLMIGFMILMLLTVTLLGGSITRFVMFSTFVFPVVMSGDIWKIFGRRSNNSFIWILCTDNLMKVSTWLSSSPSSPWVHSLNTSFGTEGKESSLWSINVSFRYRSLIFSLVTIQITCMTKKTEGHWQSRMNL